MSTSTSTTGSNVAQALTKEQYINLTTFRKSGVGVPTPVWFATEGDTLYVYTGAGAGKVKRIRANGRVTFAASNNNGKKLKGPIHEGTARVLPESDGPRVDALLSKKYGVQKRLIGVIEAVARRFGRMRQTNGGRVYIAITPA